MKIEETYILGLKLIHLDKFFDKRGSFLKVFSDDFFSLNNLDCNFKESYFSISNKNVIRGMHFQVPPYEHTKLVYLSQGKILDVILDIRKSSQTYGQYYSIELNSMQPILIYIPVGCAHGFLTLEDNSIVTYLQTSCYHSDFDKGIKYNSFKMNWGIDNPLLSERDLKFPNFSDINFEF